MNFEITKHAKTRMEERGIREPSGRILYPARKWTRKRIKSRCKKEGFKDSSDYIYWWGRDDKNTIYVCKIKDAGVYTVITAFNLGRKTQ